MVTVSLLSRDSTLAALDAAVFREVRDLILFHVFGKLFQFVSKYYHNEPVYFSS